MKTAGEFLSLSLPYTLTQTHTHTDKREVSFCTVMSVHISAVVTKKVIQLMKNKK